MKYQRLTVASIRPLTENRAKHRQQSGRSPLYLTLITTALLILSGCGAGSPNGGGTPPPPNSVPTITAISPASATAGGATFTITISGSGFASGSVVTWNGTALSTTLSGAELTADVTASDIATPGAAQLTVITPAPGGGASNPAAFLISGTAPAAVPGFLYISNTGTGVLPPGIISAFSVDPTTGALTEISGSPFLTPTGPSSLAVDPSNKILYISSNLSNSSPTNDMSVLSINPSTGALTPIPGSPFVGGVGVSNIAVDPTGKFVFSADSGDGPNITVNNSVSELTVDATTGALTEVVQAPCMTSFQDFGDVTHVAADPAGGFLFAINDGVSPAICSFSTASSGVLQPVQGSPFLISGVDFDDATGLVVDPLGKYLYIVIINLESGPGGIRAFAITPNSGVLTPVSGSPFSTHFGTGSGGPPVIAMDPLDRFLFIADLGSLVGFSINPTTGALAPLAGFPILAAASTIAIDPSGRFLYTTEPASAGLSISAYAINETTGALTPVPGSPFLDPDGIPNAITITRKVP